MHRSSMRGHQSASRLRGWSTAASVQRVRCVPMSSHEAPCCPAIIHHWVCALVHKQHKGSCKGLVLQLKLLWCVCVGHTICRSPAAHNNVWNMWPIHTVLPQPQVRRSPFLSFRERSGAAQYLCNNKRGHVNRGHLVIVEKYNTSGLVIVEKHSLSGLA